MSRRLVLLSAAAIGAVYTAGYLGTRAADASLGTTTGTSTGTSTIGSSAVTTESAPIDALAAVQAPAGAAPPTVTATAAGVSTATTEPPTERTAASQHAAPPPPTAPAPTRIASVQQAAPPPSMVNTVPKATATTVPGPVATAPPVPAHPTVTPVVVKTAPAQQAVVPVPERPTVTPAVVRYAPRPTATAAPARATPIPQVVATAPERPTVTPTIIRAVATPIATARPARSGYRNGTFTALGTSRRGDIQVALTIQSGRIATVAITAATTQYPVSWISPLRGEVVARQSAQVDLVSGATFSSLAFQGAVQRALAQATA